MTIRSLFTRGLAAGVVLLSATVVASASATADDPCNRTPKPSWCFEIDPPPVEQAEPTSNYRIARSVHTYDGADQARTAAQVRVDEILDNVKRPTRQRLSGQEVRVHLIPADGVLRELPEFTAFAGVAGNAGKPNEYTWDEVAGVCKCGRYGEPENWLSLAVGEEQVFSLLWTQVSPRETGFNSFVLAHEVAHAVQYGGGFSPAQSAELNDLHTALVDRVPGPVLSQYSLYHPVEYFAEATAAWFEYGGGNFTRSWLAENDPGMYALLAEIYDVPAFVPECQGHRSTRVVALNSGPATGTSSIDVIMGSAGPDVIFGVGGDDFICGQGGANIIDGGPGNDQILGGPADDRLIGGTGNDVIRGLEGDDRIEGGDGNDLLYGFDSSDAFNNAVGPGDDTLIGGPGTDTLYGGTGNDHLVDTSGSGDTLKGGTGNDDLDARDQGSYQPDTVAGGFGLDRCGINRDDNQFDCELPLGPSVGTGPPPVVTEP